MAKQILVVGINTVGKTSVIQGLAEESNTNKPLNEDVFHQPENRILLEREKHQYCFIEMAGLAEAIKSKEDEDYKVNLLYSLLEFKKCQIDLIIFVTRSGTIHSNDRDMYVLIASIMPDTPKICVVTGCENEFDMNQWAKANEAHFTRNNMVFQQILGTCFGRGGRFEKVFGPLRKESSIHLWNCINSLLDDNAASSDIKSIEATTTPVTKTDPQTPANSNNIYNENSNPKKRSFFYFKKTPSSVAQQVKTE
ncbi:unnamed protein product [Adineta ricciae]|uniref:G domain-containing protein n=1 Tax=Adineta ricciae TaxID=249248 RepID=A0A815WKL2_ADIRI|nr:unnamed protein product [Adineta ricciae]CAF1662254.1 unnamed protein product [Adineta ricciae]